MIIIALLGAQRFCMKLFFSAFALKMPREPRLI